jgi:hypothetical protein
MLATAREQSRAFSFLRSLRPFSIGDLIMPVVDERLIAKAKTLRAQGMTQEEIAVELGVVQSTVSTILRQHGLGGKLVKAQKLGEGHESANQTGDHRSWGRGADAAGVPDPYARNGANRVLHHRRIGQHGVRPGP